MSCDHGVQGTIPDMTSTTDMYLQLQRTYRRKAEADAAVVEAHVQALLSSIGRDAHSISHAAILSFVKNARNLRCACLAARKRGSSLGLPRSSRLPWGLDTQTSVCCMRCTLAV